MAFAGGWNQVCIPIPRLSNVSVDSILSSGADFVFIPERPPKADPWEDEMCEIIHKVPFAQCHLFSLESSLSFNLAPRGWKAQDHSDCCRGRTRCQPQAYQSRIRQGRPN